MEALALGFTAVVVGLAISALRGRAAVRACCPPPEGDLRMREVAE